MKKLDIMELPLSNNASSAIACSLKVHEASNRGGKDIMNFYADIAGRSKDLTNLLKLPAYKDVDRDELMVIGSFANGLNKNNPRTLR